MATNNHAIGQMAARAPETLGRVHSDLAALHAKQYKEIEELGRVRDLLHDLLHGPAPRAEGKEAEKTMGTGVLTVVDALTQQSCAREAIAAEIRRMLTDEVADGRLR